MGIGERLLRLQVEFQQSVADREVTLDVASIGRLGAFCSREPEEIGREYESVLREITGSAS